MKPPQAAEIYCGFNRTRVSRYFNQFLGELQDSPLVELAVQLVEAVDELPEDHMTLDQALVFFQEVRRRREEQKLMSQLRRTDAQIAEQDQVDLLRDCKTKENSRFTPGV
jgi:hypothetical protein